MLEHIEIILATLTLLGSMVSVLAVGGILVGRIISEMKHLAESLERGFSKNHDDHAELAQKTDDLAERVTRVETKISSNGQPARTREAQ
jgi:hypothetical protein